MTVPALRRLLFVCFTASGAAALIYQVAWVRLLTLALGHTVAAASTVLAAFMGGLAVGAWAAGRRSARNAPPLALYAGLELVIAGIALVLPHILAAFDPLLVVAYADGTAPLSFAIARVMVALTLIGIPAAAMGATYPLAVLWLMRLDYSRPTAIDAGALYAANSAGAAAGAIAAGFWLIEALGVRGTTWVAVGLNLVAASLALWLGRVERGRSGARQVAHGGRRAARAAPLAERPRPLLAAAAATLSGFSALVYEVAWTRLLALTLGPTTYAFAAMAASFITGIALGSSLGVRFGRRHSARALWLAGTLVATGAATMLAASFTASRLPLLIARDVAASTNFETLLLRQTLTIALVLLPASICLGATFSLALAVASPGPDESARDTAHIYVANTIGAVAGALTAGFVLVPRFGLQATFLLASSVLLVAGLAVAARANVGRPGDRHAWRSAGLQASRRGLAALAALIGVVIVFGGRTWDRDLITSGAYKYSRNLDSQALDATLRAGTLEYYREGAAATVSVRRLGGSRALAIDGKVDASNAGDMLTQRLLGLLPVLLHDSPADALVIGLGSGVTADAVLASGDVQRVDVVEISPEVVEASAFFARENRGVLEKPGVRLLIGDGRSHVQLSTRQYDVIISEPSNPWMAGVAALFTREFFEAVRTRLRPDGVFCQWAHTYEIAEQDLQSIVHTFASVFPDGTLWLVGDSDLLLIGSRTGDLASRVAGIPERWRKGSVPALLADVAVAPDAASFVLLSLFAGGPAELTSYGNGAAVQTDDEMLLEFTAVRALYAPPGDNASHLRALRARAVPPGAVATAMQRADARDWTARGLAGLKATAFGMAHESFRRALALDSRSAVALRGSTDAASGAHREAEEAAWLRSLAAAEPDNAPARVELSHILAALGHTEEAIAAAVEATRIDPASAEPLEQLASIFADLGDAARLAPIADTLVQRFPAREEGRYYQAAALFLQGRAADAERAIGTLLNMNPRHAKGQNLRGVACASLGNHECAKAAFDASMTLNPRDPSAYVNLGYFHLENGDPAAAAAFFREALAIDTTSEAARRGLADARAAQDR